MAQMIQRGKELIRINTQKNTLSIQQMVEAVGVVDLRETPLELS